MAIKRITIDREKCIGAASCIAVAEKVYALDDENKAILIDPVGADDETILESARVCPTAAIILHDENDNQIYPEE
jgi:ferredoxin